jgi:hypothetical protein
MAALFLFVILFGLAMDYHVFILSRVRESYLGGMSTTEAVRHGISPGANRQICLGEPRTHRRLRRVEVAGPLGSKEEGSEPACTISLASWIVSGRTTASR